MIIKGFIMGNLQNEKVHESRNGFMHFFIHMSPSGDLYLLLVVNQTYGNIHD
jgi:hypothetical protein